MRPDKSSARAQRIYTDTLVTLRRLAWILHEHQTVVLDQVITEAYNKQPEHMRQAAEELIPNRAPETEQA